MVNYSIKGGKFVADSPKPTSNSTTTSLVKTGGSTLTIINKDTGQVVRQGTNVSGGSGVPSVAAPTQEQINAYVASGGEVAQPSPQKPSPNGYLVKEQNTLTGQITTRSATLQDLVKAGVKPASAVTLQAAVRGELPQQQTLASQLNQQNKMTTAAQIEQKGLATQLYYKPVEPKGQPAKTFEYVPQGEKVYGTSQEVASAGLKKLTKVIPDVVYGGIETGQDFVLQMRDEASASLPKNKRQDRIALGLASIPITAKTLLVSPFQMAAEIITQPSKALEIANTPKKVGGLILTAVAFKGAGGLLKVPKIISRVGIPKIKLSELKGTTEAFPTLKGGIKELKQKMVSGETQKVLKQKFPELATKKEPLVIRTTTQATDLSKVKSLGQYEEAGAFYGTDVSTIGLPQFAGYQARAIPKISLFKAGTEQGMIEVLKPKAFKLIPGLKEGKIPSFSVYKKASEFVGIKLENLGTAIKGVSRIRVKAGQNILEREYAKISTGRRPFKLREIDTLTGGRKATMEALIEPKAKPGVVYPSRAFQLKATTESEVVLFPTKGTILERTGVKGLRQKYLGYSSAYATEGLESAGIKFYKPITATEFAKKPLIEKVSIKLESLSLANERAKAARFSRGEVFEYKPIVTLGRVGALSVPIREKSLSLSGREVFSSMRIPVRELTTRVSSSSRNLDSRVSLSSRDLSVGGRESVSRVEERITRVPVREVESRITPREIRVPVRDVFLRVTDRVTRVPVRETINRVEERTTRIPVREITTRTTERIIPNRVSEVVRKFDKRVLSKPKYKEERSVGSFRTASVSVVRNNLSSQGKSFKRGRSAAFTSSLSWNDKYSFGSKNQFRDIKSMKNRTDKIALIKNDFSIKNLFNKKQKQTGSFSQVKSTIKGMFAEKNKYTYLNNYSVKMPGYSNKTKYYDTDVIDKNRIL